MLGITDLKTGTAIVHNGDPCVVTWYQHSKMGRSGSVLRTKLRNLRSNAMFDITFKGSDMFEEATLVRQVCQYLYPEGTGRVFMNTESFDQFTITDETIGSKVKYLKEGGEFMVLFFEEAPVSVQFPVKMEFLVTEAMPGVKGDTVSGGTKPATLETGAVVNVPLFINQGDVVRVNTDEETYVERVSKA